MLVRFKRIYSSSPVIKQLAEDSFWSMFGAVFSKGLVFLIWVVIARILGVEQYGEFGIIRSTVIMFASFAGLGLGITANKFIAEYKDKEKSKASRVIGLTLGFGAVMGLLVGILMFVLAPFVSTDIMKAPHLVFDFQLCSIMLLFSSVNGAQLGVLQGLQSFKTITKISIIQIILSAPIFIIGTIYFGVRGAVVAFVVYNVIICILSYISINKECKSHMLKIDYRNALLEKTLLIKYSIPAFMSGLMVVPIKWFSESMLVSSEKGFYEMGLFTAGITFQSMILMGANTLNAPFLSLLTKNPDHVGLSKLNVFLPWIIGVFISLPFIIFPEIAVIVFGKTYNTMQFKYTFIIIAFFTVIIMYKQGFARLLAVHNLQWWGALSNLFYGVILLISFFYLRKYGAFGLSLSIMIAYVINTVCFIPLYLFKELIPKKLIVSKYILIQWILIIFSCSVFYLTEAIIPRIILFIIIISLGAYIFKLILRR